ncbi:brachyurin-like [Anopheles darlingi]|uniref:brachyurin-like n=1 Tax=Anopheles darlingi TaxID=43151 RepID=UPI0021005F35|nr:brachyurin-like [Anopheles darlingi]
MQVFVVLVALFAVVSAKWIDIDWSKVRPIEEFDHYWARLPAELQIYRHAVPSHRIVGGQEASPGQFPYQVALLGEFEFGIALCGGSILTNLYVLTAAHCIVEGPLNEPITGGIAIIGAQNHIVVELSQQRIPYEPSGIVAHPLYTLTNIRNDIGVVRLNSPITFNNLVQPVRLPARSDNRQFGGLIGTVSGFGRTSDANPAISDVLMYTSNPVMINADCISYYNSDLIEPQNVCLSSAGGRNVCNSDSGGPLTVQDDGSLQIGVVSFGSVVTPGGGCEENVPSVYARVTYYLEWIEANSDFVANP